MVSFMTRIVALLFMGLVLFIAGCEKNNSVPEVEALVYEQAKPISPFLLTDQHGAPADNSQFMDHWNLVFLGYTSCPDICPMTLAKLTAIQKQLSQDYKVQVWFVAVDPKRDTTEKRKAYIDYFNPNFLAVSGPHKQLFPFVRELGLIYAINDSDQQEYAVDHSASVVLVDPTGSVRAIFKPQFKQGNVPLVDASKLTEEFKLIADYYAE
jgi:protein SCO1/2|tara:strand:+ start:865 stop:1494 length:630 start_codon:yes stop_codon:yes gene_type:complete